MSRSLAAGSAEGLSDRRRKPALCTGLRSASPQSVPFKDAPTCPSPRTSWKSTMDVSMMGSTLGPSRRSPPHGMLGLDPNVAPAASAEPPQKSSVICLEDPSDDRPKFSVTIGHFARQSTTIPAVRQPSTTFSLGEGSKKQFKKDQ